MDRSLTIILFSLALAAIGMAQNTRRKSGIKSQNAKAPQAMPTVDQILDKYVQALGGATAFGKLTTRFMNVTIENQNSGITGSFDIYAQAPNKQVKIGRAEASNGLVFEISRGFNGTVGWSLNTTETGFRELSGTELAKEKRDADFYRQIKLRELYPQMTLIGQEKVGVRAVYVIEAMPVEGSPEKWYFDKQTGLLVRTDFVEDIPNGMQFPVEIYYEDYRDVNGIKLPFIIRLPRAKIIFKVNDIKHNIPIEEAKFKSPESAVAAFSPSTVDEYIQAEMKKRRIPGLALVVIKDGEVVKMEGYGLANLEHNVPVTSDTVFELASVTKQFTATAIMLLAEEEKIKLNDPILKYLPRSPRKWVGITVRHLLTHTAGLASLDDGFASLTDQTNYTTAEMFKSATKDPMSFTPGKNYQYSDVGYFLLGMIIEKISGQRYKDFLAERFFKPFGMTSTSVDDQWAILKNRAAGYTIRDRQLVNIRRVAQIELPSHYGVFSTVRDLAKWETALAGGRVLRESSLAAMWTPVILKSGRPYPYGFGWEIHQTPGRRIITHAGYTGTEYTRWPDDNLTVIVLTNLGLHDGDEPVNSWGLTQGVAVYYLRELLPERVAIKVDPKNFDAYTGQYKLKPKFIITITREGDRLMAQATGQIKVEIFPESETKFFYKVVDAQITFVKDKKGAVTHLILHQGGDRLAKKIE